MTYRCAKHDRPMYHDDVTDKMACHQCRAAERRRQVMVAIMGMAVVTVLLFFEMRG